MSEPERRSASILTENQNIIPVGAIHLDAGMAEPFYCERCGLVHFEVKGMGAANRHHGKCSRCDHFLRRSGRPR